MDLTYAEVGATKGPLPAGYQHVRVAAVIGHGRAPVSYTHLTLPTKA